MDITNNVSSGNIQILTGGADGIDDRHTCAAQHVAKIPYLANPGGLVFFHDGFLDAERHCFHVATREATVGMQAFEHDHEVLCLQEYRFIIAGKEATDIDQQVLLRGHRAAIGQVTNLAEDLAY